MLGFRKREQQKRIRRILVVEDEPLVAFDIEHMLEDAGYVVVATVDSFEAAKAVINAEAIDLVMTDIMLRGDGDGRDIARAAAAKGIPVLLVTGQIDVADEGSALGCLAKPYTDRALEAALRTLDAVLQGRKVKKLPRGLSLFSHEPVQASAASS